MDIGTDNAFAKMPAALVEEFSPTLPPNFPKSRIPSNNLISFSKEIENICQKELLYLYKCTMIFGVAMKCGKEYDDFQFCKRERVYFTNIRNN